MVNGLAKAAESQPREDSLEKLFAKRFPNGRVKVFDLLRADQTSLGDGGLRQRGEQLLHDLQYEMVKDQI